MLQRRSQSGNEREAVVSSGVLRILIRLDENLNVSESACLDSCTPQSVYYFVHGGVEIHTDSMCADVPGNHYCESNPAPYDCAAADGVDEFSCVTGCKVAQELKDSF